MAKDLLSVKKKKSEPAPEQAGQAEQDIKKVIESVQGKSEAQLEKELIDSVKKQVAAGTFDAAMFDTFYASASPLLSGEQREKMQRMIAVLKQQAND